MSLLKEFARGDSQADLKDSDGSDAGKGDTAKKTDVGFSLMRNMVNKTGSDISGSDVNNYLERAHELNDEVESVGFALEDDTGGIIKVYVNAQDADAFEEQMSKLLGLDDDIEAAINTLAQKFDIVDVVWPEAPLDGSDKEDQDTTLSIDSSAADFSMDNEDDLDDALPADTDEPVAKKNNLMRDIEAAAAADKAPDETPADDEAGEPADDEEHVGELEPEAEDEAEEEGAGDEEEGEEELEPVLNDDGSQKLDKEGNPVMRKKKHAKKETEEAPVEEDLQIAEDVRGEVDAHVKTELDKGMKGQYFIKSTITGGSAGRKTHPVSKDGKIMYFKDQAKAQAEAEQLAKVKNQAGAKASYKYEVKLVEDTENTDMADVQTIGSRFLDRILEAEDNDGIKDGLNIPLDSQQRMLVSRLKRPLEKRIIGLFSMAGILGRLMVALDTEEGVRAGGELLRKNRSAKSAFDAFYTALANAKGFGAQEVSENINESKLKRGSALQKKFETILVKLGLPGELVSSTGPGVVAPFLFKTAKMIEADSALHTAMNKLAVRLGISAADAQAPAVEDEKVEKVEEAVDVGTDDFAEKVVALAVALGIPEKNLQFQRPNLVKGLRFKKQSLTNRGMIMQRMDALLQMVMAATKAPAQEPAAQAALQSPGAPVKEGLILEAFGDLEAITGTELEKYSVVEPNAGPAMEAAYEGGGTHEDTKLIVGVDPERDDQKNLTVEIVSPWDGVIHRKSFTNDKLGYKAALDYANMLRTANLKTGGRPRGWKDEVQV